MNPIKNAKISFTSKVKFFTDKDIKETMDEWGLESIDQIAEEIDAVGYASVRLEEKEGNPCDEEGYLFIF